MKTVKDKQVLVAADFAGFELKEAVVAHLKKKGWTVTDIGVALQMKRIRRCSTESD